MPTDPPDWQKRNKEILKEAFRRALEEKQGKQAQKTATERGSTGSAMVKKDSPSMSGPRPPRSTGHTVVSRRHYHDLSAERAKANEEVRKARAAAEDAKKRAAAKPAPAQNIQKAAGHQKANQQQSSAANQKMNDAIAKAKAEITGKQSQVMVKSDFNKASGGREGR